MNTIIHAGYPKTGTKLLQGGLFQNLDGITYLGRPPAFPEVQQILDMIEFTDSINFSAASCAALYATVLDKAAPLEDTVMISDEMLMTPDIADRGVIAERLRAVFGPAKVLVVIRSQTTMIPSWYTQFFARDHAFEATLERELENNLDGFWAHLRYYDLLVKYRDVFGADNLWVVPYELLEESPSAYYTELCRRLDSPFDDALLSRIDSRVNVRATSGNMLFRKLVRDYERLRGRFAPWFRPSRVVPFYDFRAVEAFFSRRGGHVAPVLSQRWQSVVHEFYRDGNARLAQEFDIDLARHGYPL